MNRNILVGLVAGVIVFAAGVFFFTSSSQDDLSVNNQQTAQNSESGKSESHEGHNHDTDMPKQTIGQQPDCSLYTLEEISTIWGVPITDTDIDGSKVIEVNGPGTYKYECDYNETDSGKGLTVSMEYNEYLDEASAKSSIQNTRDGAKFGDTVYFINDEVEGIGDEAFFSKNAREDAMTNTVEEQLYVRHENVVYLITAVNLDGTQADYRDKILETFKLKLQ